MKIAIKIRSSGGNTNRALLKIKAIVDSWSDRYVNNCQALSEAENPMKDIFVMSSCFLSFATNKDKSPDTQSSNRISTSCIFTFLGYHI